MQNCFLIFNLNFSFSFIPYFKLIYLCLFYFLFILLFKKIMLSNNLFSFWNILFSKKLRLNFIQLRLNKNFILLLSIISLFFLILSTNYLGFIPYSLCLSRHIRLTIPVGFFFFIFRLIKLNFTEWKNFFLHLIINNVPLPLSPLLILIERVGVLIRPLTLSIRLAANITAGHLIIFIICSILSLILIDLLIFWGLIFIFFLETFVCLIQSYVFSILSLIYITRND